MSRIDILKKHSKRERNPSGWQREKRKRARVSGESYTNSRGVAVSAKKPGPSCECRLKCYDKIPETKRLHIFKEFYSLKTYNEQSAYLFSLIRVSQAKRSISYNKSEAIRQKDEIEISLPFDDNFKADGGNFGGTSKDKIVNENDILNFEELTMPSQKTERNTGAKLVNFKVITCESPKAQNENDNAKGRKTGREKRFEYFVLVDNFEMKVCKLAFCNIHSISAKRVSNLCLKKHCGTFFPHDERGKHKNRPRKISEELLHSVRNHIRSMIHSDSLKNFLKEDKVTGVDINLAKLHRDYLQKYESDSIPNPLGLNTNPIKVKIWLYTKIFYEEVKCKEFYNFRQKFTQFNQRNNVPGHVVSKEKQNKKSPIQINKLKKKLFEEKPVLHEYSAPTTRTIREQQSSTSLPDQIIHTTFPINLNIQGLQRTVSQVVNVPLSIVINQGQVHLSSNTPTITLTSSQDKLQNLELSNTSNHTSGNNLSNGNLDVHINETNNFEIHSNYATVDVNAVTSYANDIVQNSFIQSLVDNQISTNHFRNNLEVAVEADVELTNSAYSQLDDLATLAEVAVPQSSNLLKKQ